MYLLCGLDTDDDDDNIISYIIWDESGKNFVTTYDDWSAISNGEEIVSYGISIEHLPIEYTIIFDSNSADSGEMDSIEVLYDEEYTLTTNAFTREGYKFTGWNTEADGSGTSYEDGTTVSNLTTEDGDTVTLYAQWEPITYTIAFDGNGADSGEMDNIEAAYDKEYTLTINIFTREGYKFTGWNTEADGSRTSYEDGETVSNLTTEDRNTVTLYAQWELDVATINITKISSKTKEELEGVEFSLYELICEDSSHTHDTDEDLIDTGNYNTTCWELIGTYTSGSNGTFILSNLPITRTYRLVETKTVDDYLLPSGQWKIEFDYGNLTDDESVIDYNGQGIKITAIGKPPALSLQTVSNDDEETDILYLYNEKSYDIPTTGAFGVEDFIKVGTIIILIGVVLKLMRKRKKITQTKFGNLRESVSRARKLTDNWNKRN